MNKRKKIKGMDNGQVDSYSITEHKSLYCSRLSSAYMNNLTNRTTQYYIHTRTYEGIYVYTLCMYLWLPTMTAICPLSVILMYTPLCN